MFRRLHPFTFLALAAVSLAQSQELRIADALSAMRPGDTLTVPAGNYSHQGTIRVDVSGSPEQPIRIIGQGRPTVAGFVLDSVRHIEISGFRLLDPVHAFPSTWQDMPAVVIERPEIVIDRTENWTLRKAKLLRKYATFMGLLERFQSNWSTGVMIRGSRHIKLTDNEISNYTAGVQLQSGSASITVERNHIHHCRDGVFTWSPEPSVVSSVIRGNRIEQTLATGIAIRKGARGIRIEGNQLRYNGIGHISLREQSSNSLILRNDARYGGYYTETLENPGSSAININVAGPGNIVDGNIAAYQVDATELDGVGLFADVMKGASVTFVNNIAYRNSGPGIAATDSPNCVIINNTLAENGFGSSSPTNGAGIGLNRIADVGNVIVNNIFFRNRVAGIHAVGELAEQALIDHNLYDQPRTPLIRQSRPAAPLEYRAISEILPWEGRGLTGPASFHNPESFDYRLLEESPARWAADAERAPECDQTGLKRSATPDLGALEFRGSGDLDGTSRAQTPPGASVAARGQSATLLVRQATFSTCRTWSNRGSTPRRSRIGNSGNE